MLNPLKMNKLIIALAVLAMAVSSCNGNRPENWKDGKEKAVDALIERVTPGRSGSFELRLQDGYDGQNEFYAYSTSGNKILLEGNTTVSLAVAYYQYLRKFCSVNLSFCGSHVELPEKLPLPYSVKGKINGRFRSFFNYCSFSYTGAWWNWDDWQWTIDFLAMNGINMPLQVTGLEGVWYNALLKTGYTDEQARQYLCGPAYFAWQWMGNIESFAGPLPKSWIDSHIELGKKVMQREIELGMHPIQQGFAGNVPAFFKEKYPDELYLEDGEHTSVFGASLAAAVIASVLEGNDLSVEELYQEAKRIEKKEYDKRLIDLFIKEGEYVMSPLSEN